MTHVKTGSKPPIAPFPTMPNWSTRSRGKVTPQRTETIRRYNMEQITDLRRRLAKAQMDLDALEAAIPTGNPSARMSYELFQDTKAIVLHADWLTRYVCAANNAI